MQFASDTTNEVSARERIWFFPHKWWQATKGMTKEEMAQLMSQVEHDAENKDLDALKKYPFVFVGDPYKDYNAA